MSKLKYDGTPLTDYVEGNVHTRGYFTGPSTSNNANRGYTESKINPGGNTGFTINGVDIQLYNYAEYNEYNNSQYVYPPSWCNHMSYTLKGGGGGGGGACGYCATFAYNSVATTPALSGQTGREGMKKSGTFEKGNGNHYIDIGNGGGGGNSGKNVAALYGNSTIVGRDNANGSIWFGDCLGNNGVMGNTTQITKGNSVQGSATGGYGGARSLPGRVRRFNYGRAIQILNNASYGNVSPVHGNHNYNTTNYGNHYPGGAAGGGGSARNYPNAGNTNYSQAHNSTHHGEAWLFGWLSYHAAVADWGQGTNYYNDRAHNNPTNAGGGGKGWARVFFRKSG